MPGIRLGVNVDHVATVRQARYREGPERLAEPDPVAAAREAEAGGADLVTIHLREDRRHVVDRDLARMREDIRVPLNLEMAAVAEIVDIARGIKPEQVTLVPERREEVTTEGGLDLAAGGEGLAEGIGRLREVGIRVSLFLDPEPDVMGIAARLGAEAVELHTGAYANAAGEGKREMQLVRLEEAAKAVRRAGLRLHAGHGLNYDNVKPVAAIPGLEELNIGHSIVSRAVFVGMRNAVMEMKRLLG